MSAEQNKATARRFAEELLTDNRLEIANEIFSPNYRNYFNVTEPFGIDGEMALIQGFRSAFPDFTITVEDMVADDQRVIARWTFNGTQNGEFNGLPPTGRKVTFAGANYFLFEEGKISENRSVFDQDGLMKQLGV